MKKNIIILAIFTVFSGFVIFFSEYIYNYINIKNYNTYENDYVYGSDEGEHGKISLKLRIDNAGLIKEVFITEHPDNEIASVALQKLIKNSLDKQSINEIDTVSGATETSNIYKNIVNSLLPQVEVVNEEIATNKISLKDPEVIANIERAVINPEGFKTGVGGYVFNQFQDADYNKNGNLVTNEYICAVLLNQYNRIEDVSFDHIASNISFDKFGKIPTGGAKAYIFASDKSKSGFNGLVNDGNYVDIFDFEEKVLTLRHFADIKNRYINKKGYAPLIYALENAIDNAKFVGANQGDTLGLSVYKVLKKKDIINSTDVENGKVNFSSNYCAITTNRENVISSGMFDNVENNVTLTNVGKILGSREKEIYTLNELSNTEKYSKIDNSKYVLKLQLNLLSDFLRGNTIDNILNQISKMTDDRGMAKEGSGFESFKNIDFIEFIDLISKAYVNAIRVRA